MEEEMESVIHSLNEIIEAYTYKLTSVPFYLIPRILDM